MAEQKAEDDDEDGATALVPKVVKRKAEENIDLFGLCKYHLLSSPSGL